MITRPIIFLLCIWCSLFGNAAASAPSAAEGLFSIAELYQHKGRYLEALSFYRDIECNTDNATVPRTLYKNMGDIYYEFLESYDQAHSYYLKQLEKFPHDSCAPEIKHRIARILYLKGERDKSFEYYQALISSYPEYCKNNSIAEEMDKMKKGSKVFGGRALIADQAFSQQIRVLLRDDADTVALSAKDGLEFSTTAPGAFTNSTAGEAITCRTEKAGMYINNYGPVQGPVLIKAKGQAFIEIDQKPYRGMLQIYLQDAKLTLVNHVPLEDYLYGVVSKEVPASWPAAVLRAQAIAARTYALYTMVKRETEPYDLYSTVAAQVYGGKDSEQESACTAVDATKELVISYDNRIAYPLYHSNSGGMTASAEEIWGWPVPYLVSKQDEFSIDMKGFQWECSLAVNDLQKNFKQFGLPLPDLKAIVPLVRDMSGRIRNLRIETHNQTFVLSGNSFRLIAGPGKIKSSQFGVKQKDQTFNFEGRGFGHGAGMSQWGACQMARNGHSCEQILQFYYPGTKIVRVNYKID